MALRWRSFGVNLCVAGWLCLGLPSVALAQLSVRSIGGSYYPYWRLEGGKGTGRYDERSFDTGLGREGEANQAAIATTNVRGSIAFSGLETEVTNTTTTASVDWTKRQEWSIRENYYWPQFSWVQPGIGYFDMRQSARVLEDGAEEPVLSIPRNTGMIFGLSTRFSPSPWKSHGPVFFGRMDYRTSLEAKRNFGYLQTGGIGYQVELRNFRLSLEWRQTWDFYNASRNISTDPPREVGMRYKAFTREAWVGLHYLPSKKR